MKSRPFKKLVGRLRAIEIVVVAGSVLIATLAAAEDETTDPSNRDPIRITADKLVTDNQKRSADFTGNVKAVQQNTVITTDRLTLFYGSQGGKSPTQSTNSIERMEANGNVRIEFDNKVAVSRQAVYIIAERKLVLSGPESKVISGQDEISGSKITFYRDKGQVALEGDGKDRVRAIIHSDHKGLN